MKTISFDRSITMRKLSLSRSGMRALACATLSLGLVACGGGSADDSGTASFSSSASAAKVVAPADNPLTQWHAVASQGQGFTLAQAGVVRFGADSSWVDKEVAAGAAQCSAAFFGSDPAPTGAKVCLLAFAPASTAP